MQVDPNVTIFWNLSIWAGLFLSIAAVLLLLESEGVGLRFAAVEKNNFERSCGFASMKTLKSVGCSLTKGRHPISDTDCIKRALPGTVVVSVMFRFPFSCDFDEHYSQWR
jgi:hypothetical protein